MFRALLIVLIFVCSVCRAEEATQPAKSAVFFSRDERAISNFEENGTVIRQMVSALVVALTGKHDTTSAWKSLVGPTDRVGIKVCATGGRFFSTHKNIVAALVSGLSEAGVPPERIIIWDRADMVEAGFAGATKGGVVKTIEPVTGYDLKAAVVSPAAGKLIWGDALFSRRNLLDASAEREQFSHESHWSKTLGGVTKIINVPVLRSSEQCGVAGCLYNATIPNLDNWRRFLQVPNPYLCELYRDEHVAPKVVLNILDGLIAQYAGGEEGQPNYAWQHATIYASKDPVALDATALREIEKWRTEARLPSLSKRGAYLQTAAEMGLGNFAPERIELKPVSAR